MEVDRRTNPYIFSFVFAYGHVPLVPVNKAPLRGPQGTAVNLVGFPPPLPSPALPGPLPDHLPDLLPDPLPDPLPEPLPDPLPDPALLSRFQACWCRNSNPACRN